MKPKFIVLIAVALILAFVAIYILLNLKAFETKPFDRATLFGGESDEGSEQNSDDYLKTDVVITATPIHSGNLKVMLSNPVNLSHPAMAGKEDKETTVPIFAYLIHHEKYGYFLVDSGCAESYASNPYGPMKGLIVSNAMPQTQLEADDAIDKQIDGVRDELKGVFFTHLHFDHTSGLPALPENLLYFAGRGEQFVNIKWLLEANHFNKSDVVNMFDFEQAQELPVGKAIDVFGDQSFWAISTTGHSNGHVSYLVNTPDHPVFIAGDACITNECLAFGVSSGTSSGDIETDQKTVERIKAFADSHPEVEVWTGHDYPVGFDETDS